MSPEGAARKAIQAQYAREAAALARKDARAMLAINTSAYTATDDKSKTRTTAQLRAELDSLFALALSAEIVTRIETLRIQGRAATVIAADRSTIVLLNPQTGRKAVLTGTSRNEDTWVQQSGTWLRQKNRVLSSKTLLDGKPIDP